MKKCGQNALRKRARRPIEPLSTQIAFKTAKMVPNGGKRALEMRQNRIQKSNHIVVAMSPPCTKRFPEIRQKYFAVRAS